LQDGFDEREIVSLPMGSWIEVDVGCRILTTFRASSEGCALGFRKGRYLYMHGAVGFFTTPRFERYVRYSQAQPSANPNSTGTTIIDGARPTVYYLEFGPGVAIWPTRQINVHIEAGGLVGSVRNPASLVLPTSASEDIALGVFGGLGVSYRLPSRPWALSFDYRIQGVPYGGLGSGESVEQSGVEVGHSLFGLAHSFGLSASMRLEADRED
jgi:hypothetical protein